MNIPTRVSITVSVNLIANDPFGHSARLVAERIEKCLNWNLPIHDARIEGKYAIVDAEISDDAMSLLMGSDEPNGSDLLNGNPMLVEATLTNDGYVYNLPDGTKCDKDGNPLEEEMSLEMMRLLGIAPEGSDLLG